MQENKYWLKWLISYYGMLQTLHLITLAYAGIRILQGQAAPFPILPPPEGWSPQAMAFLYGLAGTDTIGILLGISFSFQWMLNNKTKTKLGLLSLTIFITGALVFAAGTFPSGAWFAHPIAYGVMVILFLPAVLLFFLLNKIKNGENI